MTERLVIWGPPTVGLTPSDPEYVKRLPAWIDRCDGVGITKIIGGDATRALTNAARKKGIAVDPYVAYNAFPRHGSAGVSYGWSLEFLEPPVASPQAREILDRHRPIYDTSDVTVTMTEFASQHPEYRSLSRSRSYNLNPGDEVYLSLGYPEVRNHQATIFKDLLEKTSGDGIQVEFVLGNEDENGVVTYGYEDRIVAEYQAMYRMSPFELPNDHRDWMQFRADYVTLFLSELRAKVKDTSPQAVFSTTIIATEKDEYLKQLQDWSVWVDQGIIDEFYIWFRTNSDLEALERQIKHVVATINKRVPVIAELSCYHPGSFQEPELMLRAGKIALDSGADGVGVYRSHAVEQLNFWYVLEELGKL